jgi:hypothetical protein
MINQSPPIDQREIFQQVYYLATRVAMLAWPRSPEGELVADAGAICTTPLGLFQKTTNGVSSGWQAAPSQAAIDAINNQITAINAKLSSSEQLLGRSIGSVTITGVVAFAGGALLPAITFSGSVWAPGQKIRVISWFRMTGAGNKGIQFAIDDGVNFMLGQADNQAMGANDAMMIAEIARLDATVAQMTVRIDYNLAIGNTTTINRVGMGVFNEKTNFNFANNFNLYCRGSVASAGDTLQQQYMIATIV